MIVFVLQFVDFVLLVMVYSLVIFVTSSVKHTLELYFLIILQQHIDTVTAERFENVAEEDCIKIKTEQHYIHLVRTVKCEQEVSVVCWCVLW